MAVRAMADLFAKRMGRELISKEIGNIISYNYVRNSSAMPISPYYPSVLSSRIFQKINVPKKSAFLFILNAKFIHINLKSSKELLFSDAEQYEIIILSQVQ
ncbi:hypothetical protein ESZ36_13365 [Colwellia demingiae]|uniref:Uncharacterized protein n=1 Tax=Colwellia demingiae TaxID=89401 RepID=A0A5C6QF17_9GAMM|nr:hypothetical protein [Colwellia demingiae]TWX67283.1 hypothetical protein ESZ36_13365 [Colwellia demingiae]